MQAQVPRTPATSPTAPVLTLEPVGRIPLAAPVGGQIEVPIVEFDSDGSLLYLQRPVQPWTTLAKWYAPDVAMAAALLCVLWAIWKVRRVARQPQVNGRLYCRACNYDLTPVVDTGGRGLPLTGLSIAERCPECGTHTARRRPRAGRSRTWRISGTVMLVWLVLIGSVFVYAATLRRYVGVRWGVHETWPVAGIEQVAPGFALQKDEPEWPDAFRLERYELPSGRWRGAVGQWARGMMTAESISPDGRWHVQPDPVQRAGTLSVMVADLKRGGERRLVLDPGFAGPPMGAQAIGFSTDSARVFIQAQESAVGSTGRRPTTFKTTLLSVDLAGGGARRVASVDSGFPIEGPSYGVPYQRFSVAELGARTSWALLTQRTSSASAATGTAPVVVAQVLWSETPGADPIEFSIPGQTFQTPSLSADGATLRVPIWNTADCEVIDLRARKEHLVTAPAGMLTCRAAGAPRALRVSGASMLVLDTESGASLVTLTQGVATGGWLNGAWISRDGRWAAAMATKPAKRWIGTAPAGAPSDGEVLVWDLSGVTDTPPRTAGGSR